MSKSTYIIDGGNFSTLTEFFDEFQSSVPLEEGFGKNLDAFKDVLRGGFRTPDEYVLVWKNSELSRERLGYAETARELEHRLQRAHPSAHSSIEERIRLAKAQTGDTVFDWLVNAIRNENPNIELILD